MTEKPTPPPWSREEENKLRELILDANSVEMIARLLNRTPVALRGRSLRSSTPSATVAATPPGGSHNARPLGQHSGLFSSHNAIGAFLMG
jgi:hypothetical protein